MRLREIWMLAAGICALALMCVLLAVCVCARLKRACRRVDCLIVLGARVRPDGSLSRTLQSRCDAAADAWRRGVAESIIVCGGQGRDEPVTEASAMRACLLERGVPPDRVLEEGTSKNTIENLRNARRIMAERGMRRAALVTSDYHLTRALWIARDLRLEVCGVAARGSRRLLPAMKARLNETMSWLLFFIRKINGKGRIS